MTRTPIAKQEHVTVTPDIQETESFANPTHAHHVTKTLIVTGQLVMVSAFVTRGTLETGFLVISSHVLHVMRMLTVMTQLARPYAFVKWDLLETE